MSLAEREHVFAPARDDLYDVRSQADGPTGRLPLTDDLLRHAASGTIFGLTQTSAWAPIRRDPTTLAC